MKKLLCLSLVLLLALMCAAPSFAYDYWSEDITVHAAAGTPTIDGTVSAGEWDAAPAIDVKLNGDALADSGHISYQGEWDGDRKDSDYSAEYKVMWDANNLYFLEVRTDDVVNLQGTAEEPYKTDGVLVFLMAGDDGSSANSVNADGYHHHIFYIVGNGSGAIGGQMMDRCGDITSGNQATEAVTGGTIASALTSTGYVVELAFPWSQLTRELKGYKGPAAGDKLGFSMVIHDSDITDDVGFVKQICWGVFDDLKPNGNYDFGGWAVLDLDAPVVIETEAAAADTAAASADTAAAAAAAPAAAATTAAQTSDYTLAASVVVALLAGAYIALKKKDI
jgi:hypothetical protein